MKRNWACDSVDMMNSTIRDLLGGIARVPDHGARSGQGSKTAAGGERVLALVLDGEHGVIGCA